MDKKKKRDLNIQIISSGLMCKGAVILFFYCLITSIISLHLGLFVIGILFIILEFEFLILHNNYRIKKLELQQNRKW